MELDEEPPNVLGSQATHRNRLWKDTVRGLTGAANFVDVLAVPRASQLPIR